MSSEQTGRRGHRQLVDTLLDAAWLRVQLGPLERYRSRGPFEPASVAGALGLAPGGLLALERAAIEHVLGDTQRASTPPDDAIPSRNSRSIRHIMLNSPANSQFSMGTYGNLSGPEVVRHASRAQLLRRR